MKKKCPFGFKVCTEDCELYEEDIRQPDDGSPAVVARGCSIRLAIDTLKTINMRLSMLQKETGETKNAANNLAMVMIGVRQAQNEIYKIARKTYSEPELIE